MIISTVDIFSIRAYFHFPPFFTCYLASQLCWYYAYMICICVHILRLYVNAVIILVFISQAGVMPWSGLANFTVTNHVPGIR